MPQIKQLSRTVGHIKSQKSINWFPGHMYSGMQAMMGKLNTIDCVVEVHDARIPFTGRNLEIRRHLGLIKPHLLVLNKRDLADLTRWDLIKKRLSKQGDDNVILTDLTGSNFSFITRGYNNLLNMVVRLINNSDRHNRQMSNNLKIMIVGIPNVGKSTLINRLRQQHLGKRGEPAKTGPQAGVTKQVENMIKVCSRPPIYTVDTPGVLEPGITKDEDQAMRLALCSTINDKILDPVELAKYQLTYLNDSQNYSYQDQFELQKPARSLEELFTNTLMKEDQIIEGQSDRRVSKVDIDRMCWRFIKDFRRGVYGKVIFD